MPPNVDELTTTTERNRKAAKKLHDALMRQYGPPANAGQAAAEKKYRQLFDQLDDESKAKIAEDQKFSPQRRKFMGMRK